jgi:oxygen-independent coproporphyrinogen III oxidase
VVALLAPRWTDPAVVAAPDPAAVFAAGLRHHHIANTAYPIAHRRTIWEHRQAPERHARLLAEALSAERLCLYVHIPFCERRCTFCEYTVVERHDAALESTYHTALLAELDSYARLLGSDHELAGFDLGGGTPALIEPRRVVELVDRVRGQFRLAPTFDISIETTPKIAATRPERLAEYRRAGIERISMGLQMVNPLLLRDYGRDLNRVGHNRAAVRNIRDAGYRRLNIDVMYGFARQTVGDLERTLEATVALGPEYVTLYRMRYKGTIIEPEAAAIDLRRVVEMYERSHSLLLGAGYAATPGKNGFSRVAGDPGTSAYLTERVVRGTPYLGLGLGAQTFVGDVLAYNHGAASKRLDRYLEATTAGRLPIQDLYVLPRREAMAKMIAVAFYFGEINRPAFHARFGEPLELRFGEAIAFCRERALLVEHGDCLRLTSRGARVFSGVVALFYSERVQHHLLELAPRAAVGPRGTPC